jgi:AcrR family transcriptional regulator
MKETTVEIGAGRRERRRRETRERLFRAAMELFSTRGFVNTKVEDITEAADLGKGTFFNYFPSKEHVLSVFAEMQLGKLEMALAEAHSGDTSLRDTGRRLMTALGQEPGRSPRLSRSMMLALFSSEALRQIMLAAMKSGRKLLAEFFRLAQERGEIASGKKPRELAQIFQQTFFGALVLWSLHGDSELDDWVGPAFELFWAGATAGTKSSQKA